MATTSSESNKRRRTASSAADLHILCDLPDSLLVNVASYLSSPLRALFAVSISASSSSWQVVNWQPEPSTTSKAIVSSLKNDGGGKISLDFENVEKILANKLTDDDIGALLTCINAKDTVRVLILAGCVNITGTGLEPLRGASALEQLDLSLVGRYEEANIRPEPLISHEVVLPLLCSIIDAEGGLPLRYIQYPKKWRGDGAELTQFKAQFKARYNQLWCTRRPHCSECSKNMADVHEWFNHSYQSNLCYICLKIFCETCDESVISFCARCDKDYCSECNELLNCAQCNDDFCRGCMKKCDTCGSLSCQSCYFTCDCCNKTGCNSCLSDYQKCEGYCCMKQHCKDCYDGKEYDISKCGCCDELSCFDCRAAQCKRMEVNGCHRCALMINQKIMEENENLRQEVEELRKKLG